MKFLCGQTNDIGCTLSRVDLDNVRLNSFVMIRGFRTTLYCGIVNKHVAAFVLFDKAIAFSALNHFYLQLGLCSFQSISCKKRNYRVPFVPTGGRRSSSPSKLFHVIIIIIHLSNNAKKSDLSGAQNVSLHCHYIPNHWPNHFRDGVFLFPKKW